MQFQAIGTNPDNELVKEFREIWLEKIAEENKYLSGKETNVSGLQSIVVRMFTGQDMPVDDEGEPPTTIGGTLPAQMELEALFRARSYALAQVLQNRGQI